MSKKKILLCNDASFSFTGFAKYGREVLSRLHRNPNFEIAELGCYANVNDKRDMELPWKFYPNAVSSEHPEYQMYKSGSQNQFGRWRFERVLLDFKPDIVFDIRDPWMMSFEGASPLRPFFHWSIMPTVDSIPQQADWLYFFSNADSVFTYSDWAVDVLRKEGRSSINLIGSTPPGCDIETYKPVEDKLSHKKSMSFDPDSKIIGTIMRNQSRKLYPDLFEAFSRLLSNLKSSGDHEIANKTFLYVHTSYPDNGWDIPELLQEYEIGNKVLFTYICQREDCGKPFCSFFKDAKTVCPNCNNVSAMLPNTTYGLNPTQLASVINTFDLYVQYAVCEGFGMPQVEAASCGVPVMSVDYSAMEDIVRKLDGYPLVVERMFNDLGTRSKRALPNNVLAAKKMEAFLKMSDEQILMARKNARQAVENHYTWDRTAKIWEEHFESLELTGLQGKWDAPIRPMRQFPAIPNEQMHNADFVNWAILNIMQEPSLIGTKFAMDHTSNLNNSFRRSGNQIITWRREDLINEFQTYAKNKSDCELARTGMIDLSPADFISYANERMKYI